MHEMTHVAQQDMLEICPWAPSLTSWQTRWEGVCLQCTQWQMRLSVLQGVGELLGQPQQRRRLRAAQQPARVNGTQFDLSSIDAGLGGNAAAACTPSASCKHVVGAASGRCGGDLRHQRARRRARLHGPLHGCASGRHEQGLRL